MAGAPGTPADLLRPYFTRVLGLCYQVLGDAALAERAAEASFLRLRKTDPKDDSAVWRATVRVLRTYLLRRLAVAPLASDAPGWQAPLLDGLASLEPEERIVLLLRYHEGLDHQKLAEILGIGSDQVRHEVFRVRRRLIDALGLRDALR